MFRINIPSINIIDDKGMGTCGLSPTLSRRTMALRWQTWPSWQQMCRSRSRGAQKPRYARHPGPAAQSHVLNGTCSEGKYIPIHDLIRIFRHHICVIFPSKTRNFMNWRDANTSILLPRLSGSEFSVLGWMTSTTLHDGESCFGQWYDSSTQWVNREIIVHEQYHARF